MVYTNYSNIPLALAVWLAANDGYDLKRSPTTVSATSLMKPTKSLILGNRVHESDVEERVVDVSDLVASRLGTAVHTAAEVAWLYSRDNALRNLGHPEQLIEKLNFNPDKPSGNPELDVYMEIRSEKQVGKWTVSGKFDFVHNGRVQDIKTTKTYNWIKGTNDTKYQIQGSIYRWLNPEIITDDYMSVLMVFTDWTPLKAQSDRQYPQANILERRLQLMSLAETERWVKNRLVELECYEDAHQNDMPACTPEELWMEPTKWAYYRTAKAKRATKVCKTRTEAETLKAQTGSPESRVIERKSEPKYCKYCEGRTICLQAEGYIAEGLLKL